ncbi:hypothetical protein CDD83_10715 [Cordyceps sp. RAO-2017]|nr:hypothetical protein CDD83_10715 [Cordyceps sp. RAO-2017]
MPNGQHPQGSQAALSSTATQTTESGRLTQPSRILHLRGGNNANTRSVQWASDVVDNEGLGRKSSKVCCIYHKPKAVNESSDESSSSSSSSSESGSDSEGVEGGGRDSGKKVSACGHSHRSRGRGKDSGEKRKKRPPSPNAYEKVPKPKPKNESGTTKA